MNSTSSRPTGSRQYHGPFLELHSFSWWQATLAWAVLGMGLALFRWNALLHINAWYLGGAKRDAGLYIWLMRSNCRDLFSLPWFDTVAFYPYGNTLAWSDNYIFPSLLGCGLYTSGLSLAAAYNVVLLGSILAAGYLTSLTVMRLTRSMPAALFAGLVFMLASPVSAMLGHPQLQHTWIFPLTILLMLRFFERRKARTSFLLGLAVVLSFLSSVYYALFAAMIAALLLAVVVLLRPRALRLKDWISFFAGAAAGVSPLIFFIEPYLSVKEAFGTRALYESYYFSATLSSYFSTSSWSWLYSWTSSLSHAEAHLFSGVAVLLLAAFTVIRIPRGSRSFLVHALSIILLCVAGALFSEREWIAPLNWLIEQVSPWHRYIAALCLWGAFGLLVWFIVRLGHAERSLGCHFLTSRDIQLLFVSLCVYFFILSFGPLGNTAKHELPLGPYTATYYLIPGLSALRAVGRFGIVFVFASILLASWAIARLSNARPRLYRFAALMLAITALLESYFQTYPLQPSPGAPAVRALLSEVPVHQGALIVLPLTRHVRKDGVVKSWGDFAELNVEAMHAAFPSQLDIVNGYSGHRSRIMRHFPRKLQDFPDARSINALSLIAGLRYIVYRSSEIPDFNRTAFESQLARFAGTLTLLKRDAHGNYLFAFNPETELYERFHLLVPPHDNHSLTFSLKAAPQENSAPATVHIFQTQGKETILVTSVSIPADGLWHQAHATLPRAAYAVPPRRLSFSVSEGAQGVSIREVQAAP